MSGKHRQKPLDHAKRSAKVVLKTASKNAVQKTAEAIVDLIGNKIAISQKFQKIHNKMIQRQLQMRMIKKYLKKDIYLQKKENKLLMN